MTIWLFDAIDLNERDIRLKDEKDNVLGGLSLEGASGGGVAPPWSIETDPTTGDVYYFNNATNETSWEKPASAVDVPKKKLSEVSAAAAGRVVDKSPSVPLRILLRGSYSLDGAVHAFEFSDVMTSGTHTTGKVNRVYDNPPTPPTHTHTTHTTHTSPLPRTHTL